MKKVLFLVAVMALVAAPAGAYPWMDGVDANGAGNVLTGPDSTNVAVNAEVDVTAVGNVNYGYAENNVATVSNTGANAAYGNKGNVKMTTGDSYAGSIAQNQVNTNTIALNDYCGCDDDATNLDLGVNGLTGPESTNVAVNADVDLTLVGNMNYGAAENNVLTVSNTGLNSAMGNGGYEYDSETGFIGVVLAHRGSNRGNRHAGLAAGVAYYNHTTVTPVGGNVTITTGNSGAETAATNLVNTNDTTITRGGFTVSPR